MFFAHQNGRNRAREILYRKTKLTDHSAAKASAVATGLWPVEPNERSLDGPQGRGYRLDVERNFGRRPLRLGRVFDASPLYFVTFCTHNRAPSLARDNVHAAFVRFAEKAERDFNVAVGRYVIMPEHVHLFVRGGYDFKLVRWVGLLKQALAKAGAINVNNFPLIWPLFCRLNQFSANRIFPDVIPFF